MYDCCCAFYHWPKSSGHRYINFGGQNVFCAPIPAQFVQMLHPAGITLYTFGMARFAICGAVISLIRPCSIEKTSGIGSVVTDFGAPERIKKRGTEKDDGILQLFSDLDLYKLDFFRIRNDAGDTRQI